MGTTMSWTICVSVPKGNVTIDGSRRICWVVPQHVPPRFSPPDPPFMTHPELNPEQVRHMQSLATIDQIAESLPKDFAREIQRSVAAHMRSIGQGLGAGVELSRHSHEV
jgi:hypothetical protein